MTYSSFLFSPAHAANKSKTRPPTRHCCLDAYSKWEYILCATYPRRQREQMPDDDWNEERLVSVDEKPQPPITHRLSDDYEGPIWE